MKDASLKLRGQIREKQAYKKHISRIDKSRRITVVIGSSCKEQLIFRMIFACLSNWMWWNRTEYFGVGYFSR
jgi:hypothetical protein